MPQNFQRRRATHLLLNLRRDPTERPERERLPLINEHLDLLARGGVRDLDEMLRDVEAEDVVNENEGRVEADMMTDYPSDEVEEGAPNLGR